MRFTLQSLSAISRFVLCVLVLVIIMCLGVWDGSLMETHFTLQSLCAISRCVSLCFVCLFACYYCVFECLGWVTYGNTIHLAINRCVFLCFCVLVLVIVCLCVWGWSLLLRDESNTLHLPIHCNCAQEEVAWGFSCRLCWHACAHFCNHYAVFLARKACECGKCRVNLFVCVRNIEWWCLFICELYL